MLIRHEGIALKPYLCPAHKITIGVGRNLEDTGITEEEALVLMDNDIRRCQKEAQENFRWFDFLTDARKDVIVSMVFNMGLSRFKEFTQMIKALELRDYEKASNEMLDSKWARQVKDRAIELSKLMRVGRYL